VTVIVREILGHADEPRFAARRRDLLAVSSDDARRRRLRAVTAGGTSVAVDLPRGSFMRHGAVLADDGERIIAVQRALEAALVFHLDGSLPASALVEQSARIGHWAGNQHLLVEATGLDIRVRIATTRELMVESATQLGLEGAELVVADVRFACDASPTVVGHSHG
jgi:urease accessory protein